MIGKKCQIAKVISYHFSNFHVKIHCHDQEIFQLKTKKTQVCKTQRWDESSSIRRVLCLSFYRLQRRCLQTWTVLLTFCDFQVFVNKFTRIPHLSTKCRWKAWKVKTQNWFCSQNKSFVKCSYIDWERRFAFPKVLGFTK